MKKFLAFLAVLKNMTEWVELELIEPDENLSIQVDTFYNEMKLWFDANKNNLKES